MSICVSVRLLFFPSSFAHSLPPSLKAWLLATACFEPRMIFPKLLSLRNAYWHLAVLLRRGCLPGFWRCTYSHVPRSLTKLLLFSKNAINPLLLVQRGQTFGRQTMPRRGGWPRYEPSVSPPLGFDRKIQLSTHDKRNCPAQSSKISRTPSELIMSLSSNYARGKSVVENSLIARRP